MADAAAQHMSRIVSQLDGNNLEVGDRRTNSLLSAITNVYEAHSIGSQSSSICPAHHTDFVPSPPLSSHFHPHRLSTTRPKSPKSTSPLPQETWVSSLRTFPAVEELRPGVLEVVESSGTRSGSFTVLCYVHPNNKLVVNAIEAYPLESFSTEAVRSALSEAQRVASSVRLLKQGLRQRSRLRSTPLCRLLLADRKRFFLAITGVKDVDYRRCS